MLVELSTFYQCTSSSEGGAIYQKDGQFVMKECCGLKCYSKGRYSTGQFLYNQLTASSTTINKILDSSVSSSTSGYGHTLNMLKGAVKINIINISNNRCDYYAGAYSLASSFSLDFGSVSENSAESILYLETKGTISKCNIVHNTDTGASGIIFLSGGTIQDCCLMENTMSGKKLIFADKYTTVIVINCSIDVNLRSYTEGSVNINQWKSDARFIIPIECTKKDGYCAASYDSAGGITVDIDTPSKTQERTPFATPDLTPKETPARTAFELIPTWSEGDRAFICCFEFTIAWAVTIEC